MQEPAIRDRVSKGIGKYRMSKHFEWSVDEDGYIHHARKAVAITAGAQVDGWYITRTSLPNTKIGTAESVHNYKDRAH